MPPIRRSRPARTCGAPVCHAKAISTGQKAKHAARREKSTHEAEVKFRGGMRLCECGEVLGDQHPVKGCLDCQTKYARFREREEAQP
jgi:hypothetical protein